MKMKNLFEMVSKNVNTMSLENVTNWVCQLSDEIEQVNKEIDETDIFDVMKVMDLLERENNLQLCLELLDERLNILLEQEVNQMIDTLLYFMDCKC